MQDQAQARLLFRQRLEDWRGPRATASPVEQEFAGLAERAAPLTAVLVEGVSDRAALNTLLKQHSFNQNPEEIIVVAMGGATNIGHFVKLLGQDGLQLRLAGLFDRAEIGFFLRALPLSETEIINPESALAARGFFCCDDDLEAELIRALGAAHVVELIEREGDLRSWLIFRNQPAQRERPEAKQLQRFMGTTSGRKEHYAAVLSAALTEQNIPQPLRALLNFL